MRRGTSAKVCPDFVFVGGGWLFKLVDPSSISASKEMMLQESTKELTTIDEKRRNPSRASGWQAQAVQVQQSSSLAVRCFHKIGFRRCWHMAWEEDDDDSTKTKRWLAGLDTN